MPVYSADGELQLETTTWIFNQISSNARIRGGVDSAPKNRDEIFLAFSEHTWSPARADRDTAFAFAFPESLPALPPA